ncbi:MAG TPA: GDP-L-fucose synthase [Bacteroidales bacterium]|nr:GDP-L-fucose synthase [Bacteroidales bacterium]HPI30856.1 GDP-L-fucose synthase [Bacteroidales bacterium]HQN17107.1 GDP-L-fucose synthase [Bacteroidales bacterium]
MMEKNEKIFIAGHKGMVGSAIMRCLEKKGYSEFVFAPHSEIDLTSQKTVADFFSKEKPDYVFLAAAKVGGIHANNTYRAQFIYENLMIATNIIHQSFVHNVKKLLFLGSSCIYPKMAPQPIKEEYLLSGTLEPTNEPYAIAKIAGIKLCEAYRDQYGCNFISVMPTNLYGYNDNYHAENAHVMPALIRRFHEAKIEQMPEVVVWGSGTPRREFLFVDDLAEACVFLMNTYNGKEFINIGCGKDISIKELAELVKEIVGYSGNIVFDSTKPDGTPQKLLDISKIQNLGFTPQINLRKGIEMAYADYSKKSRA